MLINNTFPNTYFKCPQQNDRQEKFSEGEPGICAWDCGGQESLLLLGQ